MVNDLTTSAHTLFGLRVVVLEGTPKYQLPEDVQVTPAFRAEFNSWAREFFGLSYPIHSFCILQDTIFVTRKDYQRMVAELQSIA